MRAKLVEQAVNSSSRNRSSTLRLSKSWAMQRSKSSLTGTSQWMVANFLLRNARSRPSISFFWVAPLISSMCS